MSTSQEKLEQRYMKWLKETGHTDDVLDFIRVELQKAAEIADRYKEPLIADEIRKLME